MIILRLIKYYPILINLYLLIGMSLYVSGIDVSFGRYIYTFFGQSFYINIIVFLLSAKFRLCIWHRLLIYNMSFCLLLETLYNYGLSINNYAYIVIVTTIITIFIAILIFKKYGTFNEKNANHIFKKSDKAN